MRLLFVHDHVFRRGSDGIVYSPGRLQYAVWRRYLEVFDGVSVFARVEAAVESGNWSVSSGPNVSFHLDHGYLGPRSFLTRPRQVTQALTEAINDSDAVVARLPSQLGLLAARLAPRLNRTWAMEVVGCAFEAYWNHGSFIAKAFAPLMEERVRAAVRHAPFALYVTNQFLQQRYPTSGESAGVSNVELGQIEVEVLTRRLRRVSEQGSSLTIGFIGSLHSAYKGLESAMKAVRELRQSGRSLDLRILGDGDQGPWRKLAASLGIDAVTCFAGVLQGGEPVLQWIDEIDMLVQPSKVEGLPRSVIEAMSRGCPIVASTAGGIPELLPNECLHSPGDWRGLASRIDSIAWRPQEMRKHAQLNWEASKPYSAVVLDAKRREFWQKVANQAQACGA